MFGDRLKKLRNEINLTSKEFGRIINKAESTISQYENAKRAPDLKTLTIIADFFDVTTDYLLGRTDNIKTISITGNQIPTELIETEYLEVAKELKETGLNKEQIKKLIDFVKSL